MGYHLIERRTDGATREVVVDGQTFPVPSVVEDDDGLRLLLNLGMHVQTAVWHWAFGAGAEAVIDVENHAYVLASTFTELRTENPRMDSYVLAQSFWRAYTLGMSFVEMIEGDAVMRAPAGVSLVEIERVERERQGAPDDPQPQRPEEKKRRESLGGFVHLHTHSECSSLDGLSKVTEIIEKVAADGQFAVAITDHGNCAAHATLQVEADKYGIKPVFGMEAYFVHDRTVRDPERKNEYYHLVLWAMNDVGLRNLWAMSTESFRTGKYYKPRVDWELLEQFSEGVMASTACLRGPLAHEFLRDDEEQAYSNLARLYEIFEDRLYVELHANQLDDQIRVNEWLVEVATELELPMVAVVDSHYPHHDDKHEHQVWLSVQIDKDVADDSSLFGGNQDYHLMDEKEVRHALGYLDSEVVDQAIANTVLVADRCDAKIVAKSHNPIFSRASKDWPDRVAHDVERIFDACMERWDERTLTKHSEQQVYLDRFEREIGLIVDKGFAGYFLIVADIVRHAKSNEVLVGPGRGSGGGSLVAYLLGITEIDPVEADLLFERFMTEGRIELPDFDLDFPSTKKQFMLDYVATRWGGSHVATVGTHMRLKSKGIVKDVARAIQSMLPEDYYVDINAVSAIIGEAEAGTAGLGMSWEDLWDEHGEVLDPYRAKYPELFGYCDRLHGRLKSYGTHPAGVIIDPDESLDGALPLRDGEHGMVTQFDMEALIRLGFVKFDLLNLRTLDTLQVALDLIKEKTGRWVDVYSWRDDEEYDDPQIFDEISAGWTLGIFQIETTSGTQMVRRFQPTSIAELADVITLVRPGPVRSGLTETYFRRRTGEEEVWLPDERLEPVLAKTYGCMVYQEDIMAATMVLAGYGSDEADTVRRILGKKKVEAVLSEGEKFIQRSVQNNFDKDAATDLWEQMAEFAKYSFNRAHAFAYAKVGFWTAWFKFHYPIQFLTAALSTVKEPRIPEFVDEARRMGYAIQPPDINESNVGFTAGQMAVRYGLLAIKGVGEAACDAIMGPRAEGGPFTSFADFLERKGPNANSGVVKKLAAIGAFDSLEPNRRGLEFQIEAAEWLAKGTDSCQFKVDDPQPVYWIESRATERTEHETLLPCSYDWPAEPDVLGRTGKPLKRKPPSKKCTRGCRQFTQIDVADPAEIEPYTDAEIREREMDMLGIYLSSTPFDRIPEEDREGLSTAMDVLSGENGVYLCAALVKSLRPKPGGDRYGNAMGWATVITEQGQLEVTIFSKPFARYRKDLQPNGQLLLIAVEKDSRGQKLIQLETT